MTNTRKLDKLFSTDTQILRLNLNYKKNMITHGQQNIENQIG